MTLRVACSVEIAAKRISARLALGERGPDEKSIRQNTSLEDFHRRIDAVIEPVIVAPSVKANDRDGWIIV